VTNCRCPDRIETSGLSRAVRSNKRAQQPLVRWPPRPTQNPMHSHPTWFQSHGITTYSRSVLNPFFYPYSLCFRYQLRVHMNHPAFTCPNTIYTWHNLSHTSTNLNYTDPNQDSRLSPSPVNDPKIVNKEQAAAQYDSELTEARLLQICHKILETSKNETRLFY
jgi:hypothetical protein